MLAALYRLPRSAVRAFIIWALGGEPVIPGQEPIYDPAALDKIAAEIKAGG